MVGDFDSDALWTEENRREREIEAFIASRISDEPQVIEWLRILLRAVANFPDVPAMEKQLEKLEDVTMQINSAELGKWEEA